MSLNETYEALRNFERELQSFDERLKTGHAEIKRRHAVIEGLWRDTLRADYDRLIGEFEQNVERYANGRSEQFETFLRTKLMQLHLYLHGN